MELSLFTEEKEQYRFEVEFDTQGIITYLMYKNVFTLGARART